MIVAIIRGFGPEVCLRLAEAYMKGGIGHVEVTFNQKDPGSWKDTAAAIRSIKSGFGNELKVGAGTVLTEEQLRICEDAGGEFMVTPNVNAELIRKCVADGLEATPGALTPSEAVEAFNAGASVVKIFPAGALGPGYIKAIKAPLSHIPLLAVGGIGPDNDSLLITSHDEIKDPVPAIKGHPFPYVHFTPYRSTEPIRWTTFDELRKEYFPDVQEPVVYTINKYIVPDPTFFKLDHDFIGRIERLDSRDIEALKAFPPFTFIRIFTKTRHNWYWNLNSYGLEE